MWTRKVRWAVEADTERLLSSCKDFDTERNGARRGCLSSLATDEVVVIDNERKNVVVSFAI